MCSSSLSRWFVATAVMFLATSLAAQRYYGRDHHVYHAPVQGKHQTAQATNTRAHMAGSGTASASAMHSANPSGSQGIPYHGTSSSAKGDAPSAANERQPQ